MTPNWFDKSLVGGRTVGSALADSWVPPGQTGIMIPYYFYPNNPYSDATVASLLGLVRQYRGQVPVIVIINAGNGPGVVTDGNYTAFIRVLQAAGAKVAGYVSTDYGARAESAVQADVDLWLTLYPSPRIDTIFFDEQTYDLGVGNANVLLYERYCSYCHARGLAPVIANPGTNQQGGYFATRTADIIVTVESGTWPTESDLRGNFVGGHTDYTTALRAALIYGQATMTVADVRTLAKYVRWVYVTHDALSPNPWDSLSTHLGDLFAVLASQNSTDAYLLERANHTGTQAISTVASLQTSLDAKAPLASPTFTGTVTAPTFAGALTGNATTATTAGSVTNTLTRGTYLTGSNYNGGTATTWAVDATNLNTASKIVARDASGNFAAGTITGNLIGNVTGALTGNASTATSAATLTTARNINGVSFNGSGNITVTANTPNTLTRGAYLTGADFNGGTATTWAVDATNLNTASKIVARDASGNFAAGTITGNLTGNVTGNVTGNLGGSTVTATGTVTAARFVTTAGATLTIATGAVTATNGLHAIDTEAAAATDDLDTINGGTAGMTLILRAGSSTRDVVCKNGTGNLRLAGDFTLSHTDDRLVLISDGVNWFELSRADNNL